MSMTDAWTPIGMEDEAEKTQFTALKETFDGSLGSYVGRWIVAQFRDPYGNAAQEPVRDLLLTFDLPAAPDDRYAENFYSRVVKIIGMLKLLDYVLSQDPYWGDVNNLKKILQVGRSVWQVGQRQGHQGLVRRVDPVVMAEAEKASQEAKAGPHLVKAWDALYAADPNFSIAALEAAKAVEAAYGPIFEPNNLDRTGSSIYSAMRQGTKKWSVATRFEHPHRPTQEMILDMLATVWEIRDEAHAETSKRLGGRTKEEATLAVSLAVTLVNLVQDGVVVPDTVDEGQV